MKRLSLITLFFALSIGIVRAGEGMWIPMLLQYNEKEMQEMGMKITADDIYSTNHSSLKDAIVLFGGGCTGEIVSDQGLLLTNHHCGYDYIQKHSSVEHDYLTRGFWAMNRGEELPCPGLSVIFLREMRDVTAQVLEGVTDDMTEADRQAKVDANIKKIVASTEKETKYKVSIKPFFLGNEYYLLLTNHHCGYDYIQKHSSVEHDYLTNGFWAMNRGEELPCPGLSVIFLREMRDVTEQVLEGVTDDMSEADRQAKVDANMKKLIAAFEKETKYKVSI